MTNKPIWSIARYCALLVIGNAMFALGFNLFLVPNSLNVGGLSGIAMILQRLLGRGGIGLYTAVMNVPLFVIGYKRLGRGFFFGSLLGMACNSLLIDLLAGLPAPQVETMLGVIFGGVLTGAGLGLVTVRALVVLFYWPADIDPMYYFYHTHNLLLQMWCEMGVAGCVTFFGAVIHNIVRAVRGFRQKSWQIRMLIASLIAGMAAMICCGIADCPLNTLRTMLIFWILFGLLAVAGRVREPAPPCEGEGASAAAAE